MNPIEYLWDRLRFLLPGKSDAQLTELLTNSTVRRELTRDDPLLFGLLYLRRHITDADTQTITVSEFHLDLIAEAKTWMCPLSEPRTGRHCYIGPRASGKSTWCFLILPLWAAAHGHLKFIAAFSDSANQAENHLTTFKRELETNEALRRDYPALCTPAMRPGKVKVADNRALLTTSSDFSFAARGLDTGTLGLKVGSRRPDLLILDDIEPGESQYSAYQVTQRQVTMQDVVLPLNDRARVLITGTVTMSGSLIHQLVQHARGEATASWITDERINVHYWPAILHNDDGTRRSIWPQKWSMDYLTSIEGTRSYAKNFANLPMPLQSDYWAPEDFHYGDVATVTRTLISIDPAITTKSTADWTGIAVVGYSPSEDRCVVRHVTHVRENGATLRKRVLKMLAIWPEVKVVLIETNQGGDLWDEVLHDMPLGVNVRHVHQSEAKTVRAAKALAWHHRGKVLYTEKFPEFELEAISFTGRDGVADDMVDAVGSGLNRFLDKPDVKAPLPAPRSLSLA